MSFLGRLFGSEKAMEAGVDGLKSGLDKLFYTKEEKAEDLAKSASEARGVLIDWFKNSQGQNLSRRALALMIAGTWLFLYIASAALDVAAIWIDPDGCTRT